MLAPFVTMEVMVPRITIQALSGRTLEQKRELVRRITDDVVEVFGARPEGVDILFQDVERHDTAKAGLLRADRDAATTGSEGQR